MKIKLLVYLFVGFLTISPNVVSAGILPSAETIFGKDLAEKIFGKKENKKENLDNSLGTEKKKKKFKFYLVQKQYLEKTLRIGYLAKMIIKK